MKMPAKRSRGRPRKGQRPVEIGVGAPHFGEQVRALREARRVPLRLVARALGLSEERWRDVEELRAPPPHPALVVYRKAARMLGLASGELERAALAWREPWEKTQEKRWGEMREKRKHLDTER